MHQNSGVGMHWIKIPGLHMRVPGHKCSSLSSLKRISESNWMFFSPEAASVILD